MKILLKNATLLHEKSPFHNQKKDVLIDEGILTQIESRIEIKADQVIDYKDLHISSGWFDPNVSFGEPGYEERETLQNGLLTAAKSGFTHIVLNPNTEPPLSSHADVSHLVRSSSGQTTALLISTMLSQGGKGKQMMQMLQGFK